MVGPCSDGHFILLSSTDVRMKRVDWILLMRDISFFKKLGIPVSARWKNLFSLKLSLSVIISYVPDCNNLCISNRSSTWHTRCFLPNFLVTDVDVASCHWKVLSLNNASVALGWAHHPCWGISGLLLLCHTADVPTLCFWVGGNVTPLPKNTRWGVPEYPTSDPR